jgi:hypothetical protein
LRRRSGLKWNPDRLEPGGLNQRSGPAPARHHHWPTQVAQSQRVHDVPKLNPDCHHLARHQQPGPRQTAPRLGSKLELEFAPLDLPRGIYRIQHKPKCLDSERTIHSFERLGSVPYSISGLRHAGTRSLQTERQTGDLRGCRKAPHRSQRYAVRRCTRPISDAPAREDRRSAINGLRKQKFRYLSGSDAGPTRGYRGVFLLFRRI